ncbi:MAG: DUF5334 family protein [Candidatus Omnitrophica bacterium]|nr:DUF5334 family protein [Candidatus Omnitrophota bacterium]
MPRGKTTRRQKDISRLLREKRQIYRDKLKSFKKMKALIQAILIFLIPLSCSAQQGFDYKSGHYVDIYARDGKEIKYYDYSDGKLHRGEILNFRRAADKMEVFDYETGEIRSFNLERE